MATQIRAKSWESGLKAYVRKVFSYMGLSMAITAIVSYATIRTGFFEALISQSGGFSPIGWAIAFGPLALILFMRNLSATSSKVLLFSVAALEGASLSLWILFAGVHNAFTAFLLTSIIFGTMSLYGYVTDTDLTKMGSILVMAVWGLLIVSIASIWFPVGIWFSYLVVAVFTGLIAYDMQMIKRIYSAMGGTSEESDSIAVICALNLYLSFLNIFIHLLRILNSSRR
ncbi:MAG: Bax inhibitor-1/YccA family protein [Rickettsiales bacterium]|jgi:FtsH-binding integral membrane protein|nr:Bax inhibitor-1/YccA family protein [Rickettsiales bacterium]